jgi:hypothetical protein
MTGRFCDRPAVRPRSRRQRGHVPERGLHAPSPRQHPAQGRPDLAIYSRGALRDISYAGLRGRGFFLFRHKSRDEPRPPRITRMSFSAPADTPGTSSLTVTSRRASLSIAVTYRKQPGTQREIATVIHGAGQPAAWPPTHSRWALPAATPSPTPSHNVITRRRRPGQLRKSQICQPLVSCSAQTGSAKLRPGPPRRRGGGIGR